MFLKFFKSILPFNRNQTNLILSVFQRKSDIPSVVSMVYLKNDVTKLYVQNYENKTPKVTQDIYSIGYVPNYSEIKFSEEDSYSTKVFYQVKGYRINVQEISDIGSYLKQRFKGNAKTIKRYKKRLEQSFHINYRLYHGAIEHDHYDFLFNSLREMIIKRFDQRNEISKQIGEWNNLYSSTLELILQKKASLFVIYDDTKPIEISLNYHLKNNLYSYASSFDTDYSKFGLGHVEIYKQLEWCLENGYNTFEMGWGDLDYKRRWSNDIYNFEHHFWYKKKSVKAGLLRYMLTIKMVFKNYLISKNVHVHSNNLRKKLRKKTPVKMTYNLEPINEIPSNQEMLSIDFEKEEFSFLRRTIYDFLYSHNEQKDNIKVFEKRKMELYFIHSEVTCQKLLIRSK